MDHSTVWWLIAGALIISELLTGTFYLLMLTLGTAAGAVSAHLGHSETVQMIVAAVVGITAVVCCYWVRKRQTAHTTSGSNRDMNLDVGEHITIDHWDSDGTAQVRYRGAQWTVVSRPGSLNAPGPHRVAEVIGSRLLVDRL
jgi:membrane protein implicated in regulation of membrane protease activity